MSGKDYFADGSRKEAYKEDSTKGRALMNPINYKGDVLTQVWIDSRLLASLAVWMEKNGNYPRFLSEIVRGPLVVLAETLVDGGEMEMIEDTVKAREMLENRFRITLNKGGRGERNVLHNQILSERRKELGERIGNSRQRPNDVARPSASESVKWIPIEEYPDYSYIQGDIEGRDRMIVQLKMKGVKSISELKAEQIEAGMRSGLIVKEDENE